MDSNQENRELDQGKLNQLEFDNKQYSKNVSSQAMKAAKLGISREKFKELTLKKLHSDPADDFAGVYRQMRTEYYEALDDGPEVIPKYTPVTYSRSKTVQQRKELSQQAMNALADAYYDNGLIGMLPEQLQSPENERKMEEIEREAQRDAFPILLTLGNIPEEQEKNRARLDKYLKGTNLPERKTVIRNGEEITENVLPPKSDAQKKLYAEALNERLKEIAEADYSILTNPNGEQLTDGQMVERWKDIYKIGYPLFVLKGCIGALTQDNQYIDQKLVERCLDMERHADSYYLMSLRMDQLANPYYARVDVGDLARHLDTDADTFTNAEHFTNDPALINFINATAARNELAGKAIDTTVGEDIEKNLGISNRGDYRYYWMKDGELQSGSFVTAARECGKDGICFTGPNHRPELVRAYKLDPKTRTARPLTDEEAAKHTEELNQVIAKRIEKLPRYTARFFKGYGGNLTAGMASEMIKEFSQRNISAKQGIEEIAHYLTVRKNSVSEKDFLNLICMPGEPRPQSLPPEEQELRRMITIKSTLEVLEYNRIIAEDMKLDEGPEEEMMRIGGRDLPYLLFPTSNTREQNLEQGNKLFKYEAPDDPKLTDDQKKEHREQWEKDRKTAIGAALNERISSLLDRADTYPKEMSDEDLSNHLPELLEIHYALIANYSKLCGSLDKAGIRLSPEVQNRWDSFVHGDGLYIDNYMAGRLPVMLNEVYQYGQDQLIRDNFEKRIADLVGEDDLHVSQFAADVSRSETLRKQTIILLAANQGLPPAVQGDRFCIDNSKYQDGKALQQGMFLVENRNTHELVAIEVRDRKIPPAANVFDFRSVLKNPKNYSAQERETAVKARAVEIGYLTELELDANGPTNRAERELRKKTLTSQYELLDILQAGGTDAQKENALADIIANMTMEKRLSGRNLSADEIRKQAKAVDAAQQNREIRNGELLKRVKAALNGEELKVNEVSVQKLSDLLRETDAKITGEREEAERKAAEAEASAQEKIRQDVEQNADTVIADRKTTGREIEKLVSQNIFGITEAQVQAVQKRTKLTSDQAQNFLWTAAVAIALENLKSGDMGRFLTPERPDMKTLGSDAGEKINALDPASESYETQYTDFQYLTADGLDKLVQYTKKRIDSIPDFKPSDLLKAENRDILLAAAVMEKMSSELRRYEDVYEENHSELLLDGKRILIRTAAQEAANLTAPIRNVMQNVQNTPKQSFEERISSAMEVLTADAIFNRQQDTKQYDSNAEILQNMDAEQIRDTSRANANLDELHSKEVGDRISASKETQEYFDRLADSGYLTEALNASVIIDKRGKPDHVVYRAARLDSIIKATVPDYGKTADQPEAPLIGEEKAEREPENLGEAPLRKEENPLQDKPAEEKPRQEKEAVNEPDAPVLPQTQDAPGEPGVLQTKDGAEADDPEAEPMQPEKSAEPIRENQPDPEHAPVPVPKTPQDETIERLIKKSERRIAQREEYTITEAKPVALDENRIAGLPKGEDSKRLISEKNGLWAMEQCLIARDHPEQLLREPDEACKASVRQVFEKELGEAENILYSTKLYSTMIEGMDALNQKLEQEFRKAPDLALSELVGPEGMELWKSFETVDKVRTVMRSAGRNNPALTDEMQEKWDSAVNRAGKLTTIMKSIRGTAYTIKGEEHIYRRMIRAAVKGQSVSEILNARLSIPGNAGKNVAELITTKELDQIDHFADWALKQEGIRQVLQEIDRSVELEEHFGRLFNAGELGQAMKTEVTLKSNGSIEKIDIKPKLFMEVIRDPHKIESIRADRTNAMKLKQAAAEFSAPRQPEAEQLRRRSQTLTQQRPNRFEEPAPKAAPAEEKKAPLREEQQKQPMAEAQPPKARPEPPRADPAQLKDRISEACRNNTRQITDYHFKPSELLTEDQLKWKSDIRKLHTESGIEKNPYILETVAASLRFTKEAEPQSVHNMLRNGIENYFVEAAAAQLNNMDTFAKDYKKRGSKHELSIAVSGAMNNLSKYLDENLQGKKLTMAELTKTEDGQALLKAGTLLREMTGAVKNGQIALGSDQKSIQVIKRAEKLGQLMDMLTPKAPNWDRLGNSTPQERSLTGKSDGASFLQAAQDAILRSALESCLEQRRKLPGNADKSVSELVSSRMISKLEYLAWTAARNDNGKLFQKINSISPMNPKEKPTAENAERQASNLARLANGDALGEALNVRLTMDKNGEPLALNYDAEQMDSLLNQPEAELFGKEPEAEPPALEKEENGLAI